MIGGLRYVAALTAAQAQLGRLLDAEAWDKLLSARSMDEALDAIRSTSYAETLPAKIQGIERVEHALEQDLSAKIYAPIPLLRGRGGDLYAMLWRAAEVEDLLILLRGIHSNVRPSRIRNSLRPIGSPRSLDWHQLTGVRSIRGLADKLHTTDAGRFYATLMRDAIKSYEREGTVAILEVGVNSRYTRVLRNLVEGLRGRDHSDAYDIVGIMIDSRLLLWAARYSLYFEWSPEEILGALLDRGIRVGAKELQRVASGASVIDVARSVWNAQIPEMDSLSTLEPREQIVKLELAFRRYRHRVAGDRFRGYPFTLGALLAYAALIEDEVHDIVTLVEAAAEGWDREQAYHQLIGNRGEAA